MVLLNVLLYLVILAVVFYVVEYVVGLLGLPHPIPMLIRLVFGIIVLIYIINLLLGLAGHGGAISLSAIR